MIPIETYLSQMQELTKLIIKLKERKKGDPDAIDTIKQNLDYVLNKNNK